MIVFCMYYSTVLAHTNVDQSENQEKYNLECHTILAPAEDASVREERCDLECHTMLAPADDASVREERCDLECQVLLLAAADDDSVR
jgi:hypothetical protein